MIKYIKAQINRRKLLNNPTDKLWKYLEVISKGSLSGRILTYKDISIDEEYGLITYKEEEEEHKVKVLHDHLSEDEYFVLRNLWWKRITLLNSYA